MNAYNDFGKPEEIKIKSFSGAQLQNGIVSIHQPSKFVVILELE